MHRSAGDSLTDGDCMGMKYQWGKSGVLAKEGLFVVRLVDGKCLYRPRIEQFLAHPVLCICRRK